MKSYIFPKGLTHEFDPKIQIFLYLFLMKIRRRIVLDDAVDKKTGFLDYKQDNFMSKKSHFSKGVDP